MKFIVEIPDAEIQNYFGPNVDYEQRTKEEVEEALDSGTGFFEVKVSLATDGGAV